MQESKSATTEAIAPVTETTSVLTENNREQNLQKPPTQLEPEILKTKVSVNQSQQNIATSQKIVIDVKPEAKTNNVVKIISAPIEKNVENNKRKSKNSSEKKMKREISLVLEATPKKCIGYVGFANLPNQVYRKAVKSGFNFNLMVVGESGLGKSTLINSMFLTDIYSNCKSKDEQSSAISLSKLPQTLKVQEHKVKLVENDVHLALTVVDTPGMIILVIQFSKEYISD